MQMACICVYCTAKGKKKEAIDQVSEKRSTIDLLFTVFASAVATYIGACREKPVR